VPERISVLTLPDRGTVTDLVKPEGRIEAGTVVAVLNKQRTQEAHEDMELQIARERLNKRDEVQKLRKLLAEIDKGLDKKRFKSFVGNRTRNIRVVLNKAERREKNTLI
jgi:hypothetical protein